MLVFGSRIHHLRRCSYVQTALVAVGGDDGGGDAMMFLSVAEDITCEIAVQWQEVPIESCP